MNSLFDTPYLRLVWEMPPFPRLSQRISAGFTERQGKTKTSLLLSWPAAVLLQLSSTASLSLREHPSSMRAQSKWLMVEQLSNQWGWLRSGLWPQLTFLRPQGPGGRVGDGNEAAQRARCSLESGRSLCDELSVFYWPPQSLVISLPANSPVLSLQLPFVYGYMFRW